MTAKKSIKKNSPEFCDVHLSVLGYKENDTWVVIALEMDLRGYGKTFKKALKELEDSIAMQICFARFKNDPDLVFHPAELAYWNLFAQVSQDRLRALSTAVDDQDPEYQVGGLSIPKAHEIANFRREYSLPGA
jgi:hypothetical protein